MTTTGDAGARTQGIGQAEAVLLGVRTLKPRRLTKSNVGPAQAIELRAVDGHEDAPAFPASASFTVGPLRWTLLGGAVGAYERTAARIAADRNDVMGVHFPIGGRAHGRARGTSIVAATGDVMILDHGKPFRVTADGTRHVINVLIPRALFPTQDGNAGKLHMTLLGGVGRNLLSAHVHTLWSALPDMPDAAGERLARAFLDLLAVARGCFGADATDGAATRETQAITRAQRIVDARVGSAELTPAWLAARLNMSRSELYALMERFGGVSRFILGRRLAAAHAALRDPGEARRIGELAYVFGFTSQAHFSRVFKQAFGETATQLRLNAMQGRSQL